MQGRRQLEVVLKESDSRKEIKEGKERGETRGGMAEKDRGEKNFEFPKYLSSRVSS